MFTHGPVETTMWCGVAAPLSRVLSPPCGNGSLERYNVKISRDIGDICGGDYMSNEHQTSEADRSAAKSCCYHVVDACGCVVGTYCCDGPDMKKCRFESCC